MWRPLGLGGPSTRFIPAGDTVARLRAVFPLPFRYIPRGCRQSDVVVDGYRVISQVHPTQRLEISAARRGGPGTESRGPVSVTNHSRRPTDEITSRTRTGIGSRGVGRMGRVDMSFGKRLDGFVNSSANSKGGEIVRMFPDLVHARLRVMLRPPDVYITTRCLFRWWTPAPVL